MCRCTDAQSPHIDTLEERNWLDCQFYVSHGTICGGYPSCNMATDDAKIFLLLLGGSSDLAYNCCVAWQHQMSYKTSLTLVVLLLVVLLLLVIKSVKCMSVSRLLLVCNADLILHCYGLFLDAVVSNHITLLLQGRLQCSRVANDWHSITEYIGGFIDGHSKHLKLPTESLVVLSHNLQGCKFRPEGQALYYRVLSYQKPIHWSHIEKHQTPGQGRLNPLNRRRAQLVSHTRVSPSLHRKGEPWGMLILH